MTSFPEDREDFPGESGETSFSGWLTRRVPLRRGLLLLLMLALLPLAVLALLQGLSRLDRDARLVGERLREAALLTAAAEQIIINNTEGLLLMLAENAGARDLRAGTCAAEMQEMQERFPGYANFALMDREGNVRCTARPLESPATNPREYFWWREMQKTREVAIAARISGEYFRENRLWMVLPLHDGDEFEGALSANLDLGWLQDNLQGRYTDDDAVVILLDPRGRPIIASRDIPWRRLDVSRPPGSIREVRDDDGYLWTYAVAPAAGLDGTPRLHVAYMARRAHLAEPDWWFVGSHVALPMLALLFASLAIMIGTNRGILRWVSALQNLSAEYARGNYRARDESFGEAPREIRDLAASLYRMARTIDHRDRTLHEAVARQKALARELNHRVKNNLQIVISLLTMQGRAMANADGRAALADARLRVDALALVHRLLYATDELSTISTRDLLGDVCALVKQHHAVPGVSLNCEVADVALDIDRAIPLTLWLVEALSDALMRGAERQRSVDIRVTMAPHAGRLEVTVIDNAGAGPEDRTHVHRLLAAIGRQLGGNVEIDVGPDAVHVTLGLPRFARHP